ncbi:MAG: response regulator transcription factor [Bacteroidales bacterium]
MKLLIIEDEMEIIESISTFLSNEKIITEYAINLDQALEKVSIFQYDCIILDLSLPDGSGLEVIKYLKQNSIDTGILILSAKDSLEDRITGLDLGADDYLTKPFHFAELYARIKSILRRRLQGGSKDLIFNELNLNIEMREVKTGDKTIPLTRKEFDLLYYLIVNKERVLSKESIVEHLWGDMMGIDADSLDFIYTHMRNLRRKLLNADVSDYIKNVYGIGYKFTDR